ncbi:MAG: hypothetical protein P8Y45_02175 [Exilibacterium sp.]
MTEICEISIAGYLQELRQKGVEISVVDGNIKLKMPEQSLDSRELQYINQEAVKAPLWIDWLN